MIFEQNLEKRVTAWQLENEGGRQVLQAVGKNVQREGVLKCPEEFMELRESQCS